VATSDKLAEINALIAERNSEFRPIGEIAVDRGDGETLWPVSKLKLLFGYRPDESIRPALDRAKIAAGHAEWDLKEHFVDGDLFNEPGEIFVTKYAAFLVIQNADVQKRPVALVQAFFALQIDKQLLEDEKRLRFRYEVQTENKKLAGAAVEAGVKDMAKFNGMGISTLYGGLSVGQIKSRKGIRESGTFLDYVGSEELAANLFRITQTAASLRRQVALDENKACNTHRRVSDDVRQTIVRAGNTLPEDLPRAALGIDKLLTVKKRDLTKTLPPSKATV
jgi:DNA-damage-inducible protein D